MEAMASVPSPIVTEAGLRALIPEPSSKVRLKILTRLEPHAKNLLGLAHVVAIAACPAAGLSEVALHVGQGRVTVLDDQTVRIPDPDGALRRAWALDDSATVRAGALVMVAGVEETLRLNGIVTAAAGEVRLTVEELFLQCPKALVRSELWKPATWRAGETPADHRATTPATTLSAEMRAFLAASPFALVATASAEGNADVSPRGDPAGAFVRCLDDATLLVPDRTGNHLVDTLRNVISAPALSLAALVPGHPAVLHARGRAAITADPALLAPSAVRGKAPKVGIVVTIETAAFAPTALWDPSALVDPATVPTMGEMILDQINPGGGTLNKVGSVLFDLGSTYHKKRRLY
ncbi:Phosphohydrolase (MutT/nudix family protein) [Minicystis rosea]|nr:Phosphohydrolase (MutT/nudix family protein) [Minicystis rosea]